MPWQRRAPNEEGTATAASAGNVPGSQRNPLGAAGQTTPAVPASPAGPIRVVRLGGLLVLAGYAALVAATTTHDWASTVWSLDGVDTPNHNLSPQHKQEWSLAGRTGGGSPPTTTTGDLADVSITGSPAITGVVLQAKASFAADGEEDGRPAKGKNGPRDATTTTTTTAVSARTAGGDGHPEALHLATVAETNGTKKKRQRRSPPETPTRQTPVHGGHQRGWEWNESHGPPATHAGLKDFYRIPPNPLDAQDGSSYTIDATKRWNRPNSTLPQWMRDYLNWHDYKRQTWSKASFEDHRWLIMQCLHGRHKCGGTSDRLKPVLYLLRVAYYTKRILLIHWDKPAALTEFLVPPYGGMDWRVPSWMDEILLTPTIGSLDYREKGIRKMAARPQLTLVRSKMQEYHAGRYYYDQELIDGEPRFDAIFGEVWRTLFTPSPAVRQRLELEMDKMGLTPYQYTAAHCRVLYGIDDRPQRVQRDWAVNALNCASELRPETPIYFTSDSTNATHHAKGYGMSRNATVATRIPSPNPPLHIDFEWKRRPVSDFLDGFVDLYILGQADCVTYNKGGFGHLGLLLSRNASCGLRQDALYSPRIRHPCSWIQDKNPITTSSNHTKAHSVTSDAIRAMHELWKNEPFYLEPMDLDHRI